MPGSEIRLLPGSNLNFNLVEFLLLGMPEETKTIEKPETSPQEGEDLSNKVVSPEALENTEKIWSAGGEAGQNGVEEEESELTEEEINSVQPGKASPMDPFFILIFIFALIVDIAIDPLMKTVCTALTAGLCEIINLILDIITTIIIGGWIYLKSKQFVMPERLAQKLKKMESKIIAKINAKITKKVGSKALRKAVIRAGGALVIEAIPAVGVFTSWVVAVISMVM